MTFKRKSFFVINQKFYTSKNSIYLNQLDLDFCVSSYSKDAYKALNVDAHITVATVPLYGISFVASNEPKTLLTTKLHDPTVSATPATSQTKSIVSIDVF